MLKFQNPWFKVRQYGALPHFLCHVLNSVKNICVNILEHSRAQQDAYKPGFPQVFQYPASLTRKPMNSSSDENKKQQNEESSTPEGETNVLDASTVKCFPAVKRSFRQKQCNWRWRWKYFTRALQPISEQGENTKDDTSKVDSNVGNSAVDGGNESSEFPELKDQENLDSNNQHLVDCRDNFDNDNNTYSNKGRESVQSKEDYSACIKLIEKFQEAVLDNAVRIIQAAYKRFRERRRFLKLKKSTTVIQRSVRQWLVLRHSNGLPALQATKPECEIDNGVKKNYCNQSELEREVSLHRVESEDRIEERQSVSDIADSLWSPTELAKDVNALPDSVSQEHEQFENSFESLDVMSLSGSTDNLSDTEVCIDQGEEIPPNNDPDSLSLADSGIDMGSDTTQEVAVIDDCECSKFENTSPLEKAVCTKNEVN